MFCILPRENRGNHHAFRQRFFQAVAAFGRTANRGQKSPVRPRSRSRRPGGNPRPGRPDSAPRIFGNRRTARADRSGGHGSPDRANFAADSIFIFGNCGQTGSDRFSGNACANCPDIAACIFRNCRATCSNGNARSVFIVGNCRQTCSDCFGGNARADGSDSAARLFGNRRTTCSDRNSRSASDFIFGNCRQTCSDCFGGNSRANFAAIARSDGNGCSNGSGRNSRTDGSDFAAASARFGNCRATCAVRSSGDNSRANGSALAAADSTDFGNNRPIGSGGFGNGNNRARFAAG